MPKKRKNRFDLIEVSSEATGSVIGTAIGSLGGPIGAVIGNVAGVVITKGLNAVIETYLSERESRRVQTAASFAQDSISSMLASGREIRKDHFFSVVNGTIDAEELFEGVLLKAKSQYQEKKIRFISNIFSNTVFDSELSAESANQILSIADSLTYQKLLILRLLSLIEESKIINLRSRDYVESNVTEEDRRLFSTNLAFLLQDIFDLYNLGLVSNSEGNAMIQSIDVNPDDLCLDPLGKKIHDTMGLSEIKYEELSNIISLLKMGSIS